MSSTNVIKGQVIAGIAQTFLDQIKRPSDDHFATRADVTGIIATTFDMRTGEQTEQTTLDVDDTMSDEPSTGYGWHQDNEGWNSKPIVPGTHWPEGDRTYRTQLFYTYANGAPTMRIYELQAVKVFASAFPYPASSSSSSDS
jgi:hypothetical protein